MRRQMVGVVADRTAVRPPEPIGNNPAGGCRNVPAFALALLPTSIINVLFP